MQVEPDWLGSSYLMNYYFSYRRSSNGDARMPGEFNEKASKLHSQSASKQLACTVPGQTNTLQVPGQTNTLQYISSRGGNTERSLSKPCDIDIEQEIVKAQDSCMACSLVLHMERCCHSTLLLFKYVVISIPSACSSVCIACFVGRHQLGHARI